MPLYIAFIDLTKAFDLVSRDDLFQILPKIGCPPKLQSMIKSLHTNMKGTVQFNGRSSRPFDIRGVIKQGCVLAPTLFGIFFALLLRHAFGTASEGICLRTRSDDEAVQSWPPQIQDKGSRSPHQRHAVCGRCNSDDPHPAGAAGTDRTLLSDL